MSNICAQTMTREHWLRGSICGQVLATNTQPGAPCQCGITDCVQAGVVGPEKLHGFPAEAGYSLWWRIGAFCFFDMPIPILLWIAGACLESSSASPPMNLAALVSYLGIFVLVPAWKGGTPGMLVYGLRLIDETGQVASGGRAFLRFLLFVVLTAVSGNLTSVWALFNERKRALHDILSGTMVIPMETYAPSGSENNAQEMRRS